MKNLKIRNALSKKGLFLYQLGKIMGVSEATITRMMREELPESEQNRIVKLIEEGGQNRD